MASRGDDGGPRATLQWAEREPPVPVVTRAELEALLRDVARRSAALPVPATLIMLAPDLDALGRECVLTPRHHQ